MGFPSLSFAFIVASTLLAIRSWGGGWLAKVREMGVRAAARGEAREERKMVRGMMEDMMGLIRRGVGAGVGIAV
jgi:hypothetical protein